MDFRKLIQNCEGFDWDSGNKDKNFVKHRVDQSESEQIFVDTPTFLKDERHSQAEERYTVYGETKSGRKLTLIFTFRGKEIRIISARDQSKKENYIYKKYLKYEL